MKELKNQNKQLAVGSWQLAIGKIPQRISSIKKDSRLSMVYQGHILQAGRCRKQFTNRYRNFSDFLYLFNFSVLNNNVLIIIYIQSVKQKFNMADKSSCILVTWCLGGNENGMPQSH